MKIDRTVQAAGYVRGLAPDRRVWIVHEPVTEGAYYPDFRLSWDEQGTWHQDICVGSDHESGTTYHLHLVSVDASTDKEFAAHVAEEERTHHYSGVPRPAGSVEIASMVVMRK